MVEDQVNMPLASTAAEPGEEFSWRSRWWPVAQAERAQCAAGSKAERDEVQRSSCHVETDILRGMHVETCIPKVEGNGKGRKGEGAGLASMHFRSSV